MRKIGRLQLLLSLYSCSLFVESLLHDFSWDDSLFFILLAYVLGHIVAYASSLTVEPYAVWRFGYPSKFMLRNNPEKNYFSKRKGVSSKINNTHGVFKCFVVLIILPIWFFDLFLGHYLHLNTYYVKGLDKRLKSSIYKKVKILYEVLGLGGIQRERDINNGELDYHRVVYHYVYEKHEAHRVKMDNYVALYGFMRAIAFIVVIVFWISISVILKEWSNSYLSYWKTLVWMVVVSSLSFFFFMGFMKFYRRFTLESLMCLVTDSDLKCSDSGTLETSVDSSSQSLRPL